MAGLFNFFKKYPAFFISLLLIIVISSLWMKNYLFGMQLNQSALNINKIEEKEKIYSYSLYNDFYYRISKIQNKKEVATVSNIIPIETKLGLDLQKNEWIINTIPQQKEALIDQRSQLIDTNIANIMSEFARNFGNIVTTQETYYTDAALEGFKKIHNNLYGSPDKFPSHVNISELSYEEIPQSSIKNLQIKPYRFDYITPNLNTLSVNMDGIWQPNILEIVFNQRDSITLQFLQDGKNGDVIENILTQLSNSTVIRMINFNHKKAVKLAMIYESMTNGDDTNRATVLIADDNGYIYALIYKPFNSQSFKRGLPDFLKLAYGIQFQDISSFKNEYTQTFNDFKAITLDLATQQNNLIQNFCHVVSNENYLSIPNALHEKFELSSTKSLDRLACTSEENFLNHAIAMRKFAAYYPAWKKGEAYNDWFKHLPREQQQAIEQGRWNISTELPTLNIAIDGYIKAHQNALLVKEAMSKKIKIQNDSGFFNRVLGTSIPATEYCSNLQCLYNIKTNNWKEL